MRLFLHLLMWLSMSVLSLQGSAATACEQAAKPVQASVAVASHASHQAVAQDRGAHCGPRGAKTLASEHGKSQHGKSQHGKCATCASCCVGSAAPPSLPSSFHVPPQVSSHLANPEAVMTSVVSSTLERPPRPLFV